MKKPVPALKRSTIVQAALTVLQREGFERLSLRLVAAELDVRAPALYWHFKNKQALINAMYEEIFFGGVIETDLTTIPAWQDILVCMGNHVRRSMLAYRDSAQLTVYAEIQQSSALRHIDRFVGALTERGLSPATAATTLSVIVNYAMGFVIEEQAEQRFTDQQIAANHQQLLAQISEQKLTNLEQAFIALDQQGKQIFISRNPDAEFTYGLQAIIAGIATREGL